MLQKTKKKSEESQSIRKTGSKTKVKMKTEPGDSVGKRRSNGDMWQMRNR